jgi:hypothetical protein
MVIIESRGFGLIHLIDVDRLIFNVVAFNLSEAESVPFDCISTRESSMLWGLTALGKVRPCPVKQPAIALLGGLQRHSRNAAVVHGRGDSYDRGPGSQFS